MHIGVAYADAADQIWMRLEVEDDCTVRDAIEESGILKRFPLIDLETQKVGIYGKVVKLDSQVKDGDRIEIYNAITRVDEDDDDDDEDD